MRGLRTALHSCLKIISCRCARAVHVARIVRMAHSGACMHLVHVHVQLLTTWISIVLYSACNYYYVFENGGAAYFT